MGAVYRGRGRSRVVVRRGRRRHRLEIDGTFASAWTPGLVATGWVWDAMAAPLLLQPASRRRAILLLGLGGASVARIARALAPRARIVGVEIDAEVVRAARRWFALDALGIEVVRADARRFLSRDRRRYDLVVEDVFVGSGRSVRKPDWLPEPGLALAARRLARDGILVVNTLDDAARSRRALVPLAASLLEIQIEDYDNRVLVAGPRLDARRLRRAVAAEPRLAATLPKLRFRGRSVSGPRRGTAGRTG